MDSRRSVEQWGSNSYNTNGDSKKVRCVFPIAFTDTCYAVIATETISANHAMYGALWKPPTITYFDYSSDVDNIATVWVAVGR